VHVEKKKKIKIVEKNEETWKRVVEVEKKYRNIDLGGEKGMVFKDYGKGERKLVAVAGLRKNRQEIPDKAIFW